MAMSWTCQGRDGGEADGNALPSLRCAQRRLADMRKVRHSKHDIAMERIYKYRAKITEDGVTKMRKELLEVRKAIQQAQALTKKELHVLHALKEKGPSLGIEVAMRNLAFPEPAQVGPVLDALKARGLIRADTIGVGVMWSITQFGKRVMVASEWLRQRASRQQPTEDTLWQEVESLYERGKLAKEQGNYEEAAKYYKEALLRAQQAHHAIN